MSVVINQGSIRSRGSGTPTHTAPWGVLHWDTANSLLYMQSDDPTGDNWQLAVSGGGGGVNAKALGVVKAQEAEGVGVIKLPFKVVGPITEEDEEF